MGDAKNYDEANLASVWNSKFRNAMVSKSDYTIRWQRYLDAYFGEYFKDSKRPDYKSNLVSNYIFSIIETIRPIMLDNDPKFQAIPRQPEGRDYSGDLNEALMYEWDRERMSEKLFRDLITTLVTGTSVYFVPWDSVKKNVTPISVNPFNLFPDPLATCPEDAEYLIYARYMHEGLLQKSFPAKAKQLQGSSIKYSELVQDRDDNGGARISNQILVLEIHAKDYSTEVVDDVGMKKAKALYPNGRVLVVAPELNLVLSDKANPYNDGEHPFVLFKDYDVPGKFWGEGEVAQLLSPQSYMNEIGNAIVDNAKRTANMPWIIDKNAGIAQGAITDRPGLIIRKNPGSEVRRDAPPPLPAYIQNTVQELKGDMEQISGVFDTLKGNSETGVYTAQGILALQEAGQARIRLKVKLLEQSLSKFACMWVSRMKQFWKDDRFVSITHPDGQYDVKTFNNQALQYDYDVKITAGSTIAVNRGAMLDLMIRLAQTQMPDGQPLVDREAVVTYLPEEVKATLLRRMGNNQQQFDQFVQQVQQFEQQTQQKEDQTMQLVQQLTGAVEKVNNQILQLKQEHVNMVQKQQQTDMVTKATDQGYNNGYTDAQKTLSPPKPSDPSSIPDSMIHGLNNLSDDELKLILQENPSLIDMINKQQGM